MKKPYVIRPLVVTALALTVFFSALDCHLAYCEATIEQPQKYVSLLLAAYLTLFVQVIRSDNPPTTKENRMLWTIRGVILLLLLYPLFMHNLHALKSPVSSAMVIDTPTVLALLKITIPEWLMHVLTERSDPPENDENSMSKNDKLVK